jgi:hypothetical protein
MAQQLFSFPESNRILARYASLVGECSTCRQRAGDHPDLSVWVVPDSGPQLVGGQLENACFNSLSKVYRLGHSVSNAELRLACIDLWQRRILVALPRSRFTWTSR